MMNIDPDPEWQMHMIDVDTVPDDLRGHILESEPFSWFHHPALVLHLPTALPAPFEKILAGKVELIKEALLNSDWERFVFLHERPYRFDALQKVASAISAAGESPRDAARFWHLAAEVWVDGEHDEQNPCWSELMASPVPHRAFMTIAADRRKLASLLRKSNRITVYRGLQSPDRVSAICDALGGWSWTLSKDCADWFAWRWMKERSDGDMVPWVMEATVPGDLISAYLTGRGEEEILIDPKDLNDDGLEVVGIERSLKRPDREVAFGKEEA